MDKVIKFPEDGVVSKNPHYEIATCARGRNGTAEISGVSLSSWTNGVVHIQPITRARKVNMNCFIELPKDKATLNQVIKALEAFRDAATK